MNKKILLLPILFLLMACNDNNLSSENLSSSESGIPSNTITPSESSSSSSIVSPSESTSINEDTSSSTPEYNEEGVELISSGVSFESAFVNFKPFTNATSYSVYCDDKKVDKELIRNYGTYYRVDVLGLTNTKHNIKIIPIVNEKELNEAANEVLLTPYSHVREGFAFKNGSVGAYNLDGTLKDNAKVVYVTNSNKDIVSLNVKTSNSSYTEAVGVQNILNAYKKGYETTPIAIRFIGNITDPEILEGGDYVIDHSEKYSAGMTLEGIGNDATFNGFGLRIKNALNLEVRNIGFMNCDSTEGDNVSLQQKNKYVWVHNCDLFYGMPGSDADQNKGDGALDCKTSTYVTFSYNHFFDSGKACLLGNTGETTSNYITYHHNWFDHSDSRHPRVRTATVHVYNNYFDGNSKYGVGATKGASIFVENNYFRNCYRPMSISMQGKDQGTFSSEDGGMIKAYGNEIVGGVKLITYSENNTSFDYYDAKSKDEVVPSSVVSKQGNNTYNNFDTNSSLIYEYNPHSAIEAKENVMKFAGRVEGGDFKWTFTEADDKDYGVNQALKEALINYKGNVISSNMSDVVNQINSINENVTLSDANKIKDIYDQYNGLSDSEKQLVTNYNKLLSAYNTVLQLEVDNVITLIDEINATDANSINNAKKAYEALSSLQKEKVTNYQKLVDIIGSIVAKDVTHSFEASGLESDFFTFVGNLSTSKGTVTIDGKTYKKCLKMESSASIKFTLTEAKTIVIYNGGSDSKGNNVKVDGVKYSGDTTSLNEGNKLYKLEIELSAGEHTITKGDTTNIFLITFK